MLQKQYICTEDNVKKKFCNETDIGAFILSANASQSRNRIISQSVHLKDPQPINYPINKTGYYCVGTAGYSSESYKAAVEFRNAYGELPAAQIAKLPFYGGLTIVYAVIAMSVLAQAFRGTNTDGLQILGLPLCPESSRYMYVYYLGDTDRQLICRSTCPELHYSHHHLSHRGAIDDLGLLP